MPRLEFVGQSARDADNKQANTSRLINLYREPVGGTAGYQVKSVLGTESVVSFMGNTATRVVRAVSEIGGTLYVVSGGTLFSVVDGVATEIGFTRDRDPTYLFGAEQGKVAVVVGGRYFVYDGTTLSRPDPVDAPFAHFGSGLYLNGYVVLTEENGDRFLWTDLADATNFEGLNFATAESSDKPILQAAKVNGRLWLLKSDVIEVWAQVGSGANAFTRVTGGVIETGLRANGLATTFTGGIFFVGSDGIVYLSAGAELNPISPPCVNTAIAQSTPTQVLYYEDEGHKFCAIRFSDRPAWVYDIVTGEWHERASGDENPWAITATGLSGGVWYCGDGPGNLFRFARNNMDGEDSLIRKAYSSTLYMDGAKFTVPRFELTGRMGVGANAPEITVEDVLYCDDGRVFSEADAPDPIPAGCTWRPGPPKYRTPIVELRVSDDGGHSWSLPRRDSMGALGEYDRIAVFRNLGLFTRGTVQVSLSEPMDITLDALANVEVA